MSIASKRAEIVSAVAASGLPFKMFPQPIKQPRAGTGWVLMRAARPATQKFRGSEADFAVVFLLADQSDPALGEDQLDEHTEKILDTLTTLQASGFETEVSTVEVASSAFLALVVTITMEV